MDHRTIRGLIIPAGPSNSGSRNMNQQERIQRNLEIAIRNVKICIVIVCVGIALVIARIVMVLWR